jgi:Kef-type K+ transport system membrane component KefB
MFELPIVRDLGLIVVVGAACLLIGKRLRTPSIVAYIVAGLLLGPVTGLITASETVDLIAEVGIALLLFLVGLELSLARIRDVGKVAVVAGLGQVVFTAAGGLVLALVLGFDWMASLFIATALTFSSTVVVVKLLDQKGELNALYGRIAVGIFLVQDLVVIVILTFLAGLGDAEQFRAGDMAGGLVVAFLGMGGLLAVALLSSRYVLPRLFGWVASAPEPLFIWSLCWCFLFVLGAEALNLSLEIGAFLAGVSLAQLPYNHEFQRRVHPLMNFFIAVFFVSLGVQMQVGAALDHLVSAGVLSLFVLIGNPLIFMLIITRLGYGQRPAFLTSVTVAQISEFSFIFAGVGLAAGLIGPDILSVVTVVGLITIATSSYMILYNHELYEWTRRVGLLRPFRPSRRAAGGKHPDRYEGGEGQGPPAGHVIVVGMNHMGRRIVEGLTAVGERVLAVDVDPRKLEGLPCETLLGNAELPSVLEEAGLAGARLLVTALQIEGTNNLLAYRARDAGVPVSVHAFDQSVLRSLEALGADHLIRSKNLGVRRIAEQLREMGVLG